MLQFLKENITLSTIIVAVILNIVYDIIKKVFYWSLKFSSRLIVSKSNKNILFLISHYEKENKDIISIVNKEGNYLSEIVKNIIHQSTLTLTVLVCLLILNYVENKLLFYGLLGSSFLTLVRTFATFFYYFRLFYKVKFHEKYILKNTNRITYYKNLLHSV
jgi:uncharacterized membrane protein